MTTRINARTPTINSPVMDDKEHRVIFQVAQADAIQQLAVANQLKNILKALPNAEIKVVCHGQGVSLLIQGQSKANLVVQQLMQQGVVFAACENTLESRNISEVDLLPGVITTPSAMAELILKQEEGWAYIKAGI